jgi:pimeloyl-ACP methyl ester carboxylesterase
VMDHLGIGQFFFFGNCIGGPFGMKLMERAPQRIVAALLSQPVGHLPAKPDYMFDAGRDVWGKELRERRPDVSAETIEKYLHNLYRVRPDFVYSVSRDVASLAPNAEITVFPWKDPPELKARTINRARNFLKRHLPA